MLLTFAFCTFTLVWSFMRSLQHDCRETLSESRPSVYPEKHGNTADAHHPVRGCFVCLLNEYNVFVAEVCHPLIHVKSCQFLQAQHVISIATSVSPSRGQALMEFLCQSALDSDSLHWRPCIQTQHLQHIECPDPGCEQLSHLDYHQARPWAEHLTAWVP